MADTGTHAGVDGVDWTALRSAAREAMGRAYAPYSAFPVGAAGLADDGRVVTGCNVENASYGLGLCAECGLVSALHATGASRGSAGAAVSAGSAGSGPPRLVAVAVVGRDGEPLTPCGRCRQLLWEHGGPDMLLETASGVVPMREVLPGAFDAADLSRGEGPPWTPSM